MALQRAEELRREPRIERLDPVADADERVTPELASGSRSFFSRDRELRLSHPRSPGISTLDPDRRTGIRTISCGFYDRRAARWNRRRVHESVEAGSRAGPSEHELQHYAYRDISHHLATIDKCDARGGTLTVGRRRTNAFDVSPSPLRVPPQLRAARRVPRRRAGLLISQMNSCYVFLKLAKLWELNQQSANLHRQSPQLSPQSAISKSARQSAVSNQERLMFSLHIDTARTWRGGQNQVLTTLMGLRALGHRTMLVAHSEGELRQRAAEGLDLVPLAPKTEMDLSAAWRLSRIIKQLKPDIVHGHDPHGVAMAALALSMSTQLAKPPLVAARRVDFHLRGNSLSRWKYRQVDCFICASEAIRQMLVGDGVEEARTVTVHEGIDVEHVVAAAPVNVHEAFWLPHQAPVVGNVAALVPHKGQRHLVEAARLVVREIPDARFIILGEGELREPLERQVRDHHLEKHVLLPGFRTDVLGCIKGFDLFAMSSVTEGLGTSLLDAMACSRAVVATTAGGIPRSSPRARPVCRCRRAITRPQMRSSACSTIPNSGEGWACRPRARVPCSAPNEWCRAR